MAVLHFGALLFFGLGAARTMCAAQLDLLRLRHDELVLGVLRPVAAVSPPAVGLLLEVSAVLLPMTTSAFGGSSQVTESYQ